MSWLDAARARLRLLFARHAAESRMDEEFRFHLEMETQRRVRESGLAPAEARRQALAAFGGVENHKEALRSERGLAWLGGASLDLKLGVRMLAKYPGLTIISSVAMAFAIWVGASTFEMVSLFVNPTLPLPGGDRIVQLRNWDAVANAAEPRALYDFAIWRQSLKSVTDLGAFRDVSRNLVGNDGARPASVAEISASAFRVASGTPLLGRVLSEDDERAGAPPVVVLGHDVWTVRFAGDSSIVGTTVQLGETFATVVGVMPQGFAFPINHDLWTPLRVDETEQLPREGASIGIFGRLAPGSTLEAAQAELTAIGQRTARQSPRTHENLRPRVAPYAHLYWDPSETDLRIMYSINAFAVMLVILICSNVALLIFARAASREGELAVRTALGASRKRIVAQLFAEALVLGGIAAVVGLGGAHLALDRWGLKYLQGNLGELPFWYAPTLSSGTIIYAIGLTLLSAAVAGVLPALKITRGFGARLRADTSGSGGPSFGGVWTAVIVTQVAITVAFPVAVYVEQRQLVHIQTYEAGFPAERYLGVRLETDAPTDSANSPAAIAQRARFETVLAALRQRVEAEPGVIGVSFVNRLPRTPHPERRVELDSVPGDARRTTADSTTKAVEAQWPWVHVASIDPSYFDVLQAPVIAGRAFSTADLGPDAQVAIVDQAFVEQTMRGLNPLGRRIRFVEMRREADGRSVQVQRPWLEIVGVAKDLGMGHPTERNRPTGLYLPATPASLDLTQMIVHTRGDLTTFAPRLRALAMALDPTLRLSEFQHLDDVSRDLVWYVKLWLRITAGLTAIALLLSLAGIYAILSFTVSKRTREIGVRVALGATRRAVVVAIFRRPLTQVALGVAAGSALIGTAFALYGGLAPKHVVQLVAYALVMFGVCLFACVVPTRRALRVQPTDALRAM